MDIKKQGGHNMNIGPKPAAPQNLQDRPVEGPAAVYTVTMSLPTGETKTAYSCALLGAGRDYLTLEDARDAMINTDLVTSELSKQYESILELVTDFPEAYLDGTARRMLAAERLIDDHRKAVAKWESDIEAAGLEPCGKCGGAGGWKGWPGFTCYDCGGSGIEEHSH